MRFLKASAIWLCILLCAILNGAFREAVLLPNMSQRYAFVVSGTLLAACIVAVSLLLIGWLGYLNTAQYLRIGALWLVLTLVFEFSFGRLVQQQTWPELLEAYTFKQGNIWPLVLVVTFFAPLVAARVRNLRYGVRR